jgi:hypothetical protein
MKKKGGESTEFTKEQNVKNVNIAKIVQKERMG